MLNRLLSWTRTQQNADSLKTRILSDPYYRFQSLPEVRLAAALGVKIDVNQASIDDWLRLPGLSIHQARTLVQLAQGGMPFYSLEDIAVALGLPVQRLEPLAPILLFCYYDPDGVNAIPTVNPNTASVEQLLTVPIIDPPLAHAIIRDRVTMGPYRNLADLQQRLSLTGHVTKELLYSLRF